MPGEAQADRNDAHIARDTGDLRVVRIGNDVALQAYPRPTGAVQDMLQDTVQDAILRERRSGT